MPFSKMPLVFPKETNVPKVPQIQPRTPLPRRHRLVLTVVLGVCAAVICWWRLHNDGVLAADFTWPWRGARALLAGENPYHVIQRTGPYPFDAPLYYPLPTLLFVLPLAWLPAPLAGGAFMGLSTALLVYAGTRDGYQRLPILLSVPFCNALFWPQWAPIITAVVLLPHLLPLALAKPSIGVAAFAARPSWRGAVASVVVLAGSFAVLPTWPLDWFAAVRQHAAVSPLFSFGGPLLLLAAVRWRSWQARLLLAMTCAPQLPYDVLPVLLVARTFRQHLVLAICGWLGVLVWPYAVVLHRNDWMGWQIVWVYLPALVIVLWPMPKHAAVCVPTVEQQSVV